MRSAIITVFRCSPSPKPDTDYECVAVETTKSMVRAWQLVMELLKELEDDEMINIGIEKASC